MGNTKLLCDFREVMKISEIFFSIQGEGINSGVPSVFVRFFGCNLACRWCDTKFSWHPNFARYTEKSTREVVDDIMQYGEKNHIVFTGGEPALFQNDIRKIQRELQKKGTFSYEIETNGSRNIEDDFWDTITISPKLHNSGNREYKIEARNFPQKTWWKFVVESENDIQEILEIQKKYEIPNEKILLMPQAQTQKEIEKISPKIIELCKKYGFRFCARLQIFVYSDTIGV